MTRSLFARWKTAMVDISHLSSLELTDITILSSGSCKQIGRTSPSHRKRQTKPAHIEGHRARWGPLAAQEGLETTSAELPARGQVVVVGEGDERAAGADGELDGGFGGVLHNGADVVLLPHAAADGFDDDDAAVVVGPVEYGAHVVGVVCGEEEFEAIAAVAEFDEVFEEDSVVWMGEGGIDGV